MLTAAELHRRGLDETNAGRHARGRSLFLLALRRQPDGDLTARILLSLAHAQFELGSIDEALDLCDEALAIDGTSTQVRALVHSQQGVVHSGAGNGAKALEAFGRALHLLDESPEPRATAFLNRGNVYLQRGDIPRALSDLGAARRLAAAGQLRIIRAKAEHNFGYASMLAGDVMVALQHMDQARATLEGLSETYRAVCNQDRAEVLLAAGMVTDAEDALRTAARAYGSRRLTQRQGEAELVLARLLLRESPREASKVARKAARRFRSRGSEAWALRADLVSLSGSVATGHWPASTPDADQLASQLVGHGLAREAKVAALQAVDGDVQHGRLDEAARRVASVRVSKHEPLATRLLDRETRSKLAAARGRRSAAIHHVRRGLADLHDWQSSFGSLDLQSSLVGHGRGLALQGLALAIEDGRPAVVFEWAERARALASRVSPVRPPSDAAAAADLAELRQLQTEISDSEARGVVAKSLVLQANRLQAGIRQRAWNPAGSGVVTEPAELDEAVELLASADGALVSYLVVDGQVHALVVTSGVPEVVCLGQFSQVSSYLDGMQADLDMAAARLPTAMASAVRSSLDRRLELLGGVLVEPLADRLDGRPVAVVPSGALAGVPWSILPGMRGRPLTVPRSATSWIVDRKRFRRPTRAGFVAGPRVARAREEVTRASEAWSSATVLTGPEAGSAAAHDLATRADVFHVAAHGRHSAENPLFSGLELADGPWFGYDIDCLETIPSTVILSACEVGRSSVRWGEETIGMTVAWLHAGAQTVVASPASVNDDAACELLAATHTRLAAGVQPSVALADAVAETDTDAPAPFVCFGSGW